jgi:hypothetical protein
MGCGRRWVVALLVGLSGAAWSPVARGSAYVRGDFYRLGDADPGAAPGGLGADPTLDSLGQAPLTRGGSPRYAADVPLRNPQPDKLSMAFANTGLGGPAVIAYYGRDTSLAMDQSGLVFETWVKVGADNLLGAGGAGTVAGDRLVAYNGIPGVNGFGFYQTAGGFVVRAGGVDQKLGPADAGTWHHLGYALTFKTSDYYYDGQLVDESAQGAAPTAASGGFWIGGTTAAVSAGVVAEPHDLFNGWIDDVRYQVFNPLVAGAFSPTDFLIADVPEPTALSGVAAFAAVAATWRGRRRGGAVAL